MPPKTARERLGEEAKRRFAADKREQDAERRLKEPSAPAPKPRQAAAAAAAAVPPRPAAKAPAAAAAAAAAVGMDVDTATAVASGSPAPVPVPVSTQKPSAFQPSDALLAQTREMDLLAERLAALPLNDRPTSELNRLEKMCGEVSQRFHVETITKTGGKLAAEAARNYARDRITDEARRGAMPADEACGRLLQLSVHDFHTASAYRKLDKAAGGMAKETFCSAALGSLIAQLVREGMKRYIQCRVEAARSFRDASQSDRIAASNAFLEREVELTEKAEDATTAAEQFKALGTTRFDYVDEAAEIRTDFWGLRAKRCEKKPVGPQHASLGGDGSGKRIRIDDGKHTGSEHDAPMAPAAVEKPPFPGAQKFEFKIEIDKESAEALEQARQKELKRIDDASKEAEKLYNLRTVNSTDGFWLTSFQFHKPDVSGSNAKPMEYTDVAPFPLHASFEYDDEEYPVQRKDLTLRVPHYVRCLDDRDLSTALHVEVHDMRHIKDEIQQTAATNEAHRRRLLDVERGLEASASQRPFAFKPELSSTRSLSDLVYGLAQFWTTLTPLLEWSAGVGEAFYIVDRRRSVVTLGQIAYELATYDALCRRETRCAEPATLLQRILDATTVAFSNYADAIRRVPRTSNALSHAPVLHTKSKLPMFMNNKGPIRASNQAVQCRRDMMQRLAETSNAWAEAIDKGLSRGIRADVYRVVRYVNTALVPVILSANTCTDRILLLYHEMQIAVATFKRLRHDSCQNVHPKSEHLMMEWLAGSGAAVVHYDHMMTVKKKVSLDKKEQMFITELFPHPQMAEVHRMWTTARTVLAVQTQMRIASVFAPYVKAWTAGPHQVPGFGRPPNHGNPDAFISKITLPITEYLLDALDEDTLGNEWPSFKELLYDSIRRGDSVDAYTAIVDAQDTTITDAEFASSTQRIQMYMATAQKFASDSDTRKGIVYKPESKEFMFTTGEAATLFEKARTWLDSGDEVAGVALLAPATQLCNELAQSNHGQQLTRESCLSMAQGAQATYDEHKKRGTQQSAEAQKALKDAVMFKHEAERLLVVASIADAKSQRKKASAAAAAAGGDSDDAVMTHDGEQGSGAAVAAAAAAAPDPVRAAAVAAAGAVSLAGAVAAAAAAAADERPGSKRRR